MQVICAWCADEGKPAVLLHKAPLADTSFTHGICPEHLAALRTEIRVQFPRPRLHEAA